MQSHHLTSAKGNLPGQGEESIELITKEKKGARLRRKEEINTYLNGRG